MKALTIRQPWASLIALGAKTIETRSWATRYRGPIAVHAGAAFGGWDDGAATPAISDACTMLGAAFEGWPRGAVVATATLADCVPIETPESAEARAARMVWTSGAGDLKIAHYQPDDPDPDGHPWIVEADVDDQLPFGDFAPGRWAWLLDDVKSTTERCPACWGEPGEPGYVCAHGPSVLCDADYAHGSQPCWVCDRKGTCAPVPAKGRQGLWEWTP